MIRIQRMMGGAEIQLKGTRTIELTVTDEILGLLLLGRSALKVQCRISGEETDCFQASVSLNRTAKKMARLEIGHEDGHPVAQALMTPAQLSLALTTSQWTGAHVTLEGET